MATIVLISCVSKKLDIESLAQNLYVSPLFKYNLQYAKSLNPSRIFILSAKYGLLKLNDKIKPYNLTLNTMKVPQIKKWAKKVIIELESNTNISEDKFIFLAGARYRKYLIPNLKQYEIPMKHLGIGKQLQWLKQRCKNE